MGEHKYTGIVAGSFQTLADIFKTDVYMVNFVLLMFFTLFEVAAVFFEKIPGTDFVITRGIADIAPGITLISSAAFFLIGLLGLSYGILSASWEESNGSILGFENIEPNITRIRSAFSALKQQKD